MSSFVNEGIKRARIDKKRRCEIKKKIILRCIGTKGNNNCTLYNNPKWQLSWIRPVELPKDTPQLDIHGKKNFGDQVGVVYYELLQTVQTINTNLEQVIFLNLNRIFS